MSPSTPPLRARPFLAGLFVVTAVTLALEVLLTRVLSVLTWYSLAFLVVGMGLFGITVGALRVYLVPERYAEQALASRLARDCLWLAAAIPVAYVLLLIIPLRVEDNATTGALFLVFAALLALPFVPAGTIVAASLTRASLPTGLTYGVDLAGAATGAALTPLLLAWLDGGSAILSLGAVSALGAAAYARAAGDRVLERRAALALVGLGLLTAANASSTRGLVPLWVKGRAEDRDNVALEVWNSHSRVQVSELRTGPPLMWARGRCPAGSVRQRWITIDGDAGTALYHADPDIATMRFLGCDVTALVHQIRPEGATAVLGVGGSRDLQTALMFGHRPVVGVELNGRVLEVLRGPLGAPARVADSPDVRLVHDDARGYVTRTSERFQVIQMSLIDTWAATGAGAHVLGENGLYTVEAWRTFLDRLEPGGVLSVSRWYQGGSHDEVARLVALGTAALLESGVERPRDHIALSTVGLVATLLVAREPLRQADIDRLHSAETRLGFELLLAAGPVPTMRDAASLPEQERATRTQNPRRREIANALARITEAPDRAALDAMMLDDTFDLRPPTDDRPFFFNLLRIRGWLADLPDEAGGAIEGNRRASAALVWAFLASLVLVLVAIVLPLRLRRAPARQGPRPLAAGIAYFGVIGVAFMLAELGLLMRLSVVLGHPALSLVVVLASLVGAAGLGSWLSDRLPLDRAPYAYLYPLVIAAAVVAAGGVTGTLGHALEAASLEQRVVVSAGIAGALGVALGTAFPAGMRIFAPSLPDETPWLWGINGVGGVLASSVGVMLALSLGLDWLFLAAGLGYATLPLIVARGLRAGRLAQRDLASPPHSA